MFAVTIATLVQGRGWEAEGHADGGAWLDVSGVLGLVVLLTLLGVLVARALLRRERYRATGALSAADVERVHEAIRAAERRTVGEVLPVVLGRSDRHPGASWLAAFLFATLGSFLLGVWLPWHLPLLLIPIQVALGALGYGLTRALPGFQRLFVSEGRATEMAEEQALQEFFRHGLHRTEGRTGVLLFVSLLEQRVVVLADEGIDAKVSPDQWKETDAAVLGGIARGSLADGLVAGIESAAEVLARHFPWRDGDRNEIPDRLIVRAE